MEWCRDMRDVKRVNYVNVMCGHYGMKVVRG